MNVAFTTDTHYNDSALEYSKLSITCQDNGSNVHYLDKMIQMRREGMKSNLMFKSFRTCRGVTNRDHQGRALHT